MQYVTQIEAMVKQNESLVGLMNFSRGDGGGPQIIQGGVPGQPQPQAAPNAQPRNSQKK